MNRLFSRWASLALIIALLLLCAASAGALSTDEALTQKVHQVTAQCDEALPQGMQAQKAKWLHDWLIHNADYDNSLTYHGPEGVLLYGTGVCDSYASALCLLLDAEGIENVIVRSPEMDHAWVMACLDGAWTHIDATWDDPVGEDGQGGSEQDTYFGMNDALMARDHVWDKTGLPTATALTHYAPLKGAEGTYAYTQKADLTDMLDAPATAQTANMRLVYAGTSTDQSVQDDFESWFSKNNWKYGMRSYSLKKTNYTLTATIEYTDPWTKPETHLETPVPAPRAVFNSDVGRYDTSKYTRNGLVIAFVRENCSNSRGLMSKLVDEVEGLYDAGVEVLLNVENAAEADDFTDLRASFGRLHFTFDTQMMWTFLRAAGFSENRMMFPAVFVLNSEQKITYYHTGYVSDEAMTELVSEAYAVGTGCAIPEPETHYDMTPILNGTGNINDITSGVSVVPALKSVTASGHAIMVMGYDISYETTALQYFEDHYAMFRQVGVTSLVATFFTEPSDEDKAQYPHVTFVSFNDDDFWALQRLRGYENGTSASYQTYMLIRRGGALDAWTNGGALSMDDAARWAAGMFTYASTVPKALNAIESEAFAGARFTSIDLTGGRMTRIESRAFAGASRLKVVRIPETVTAIADDAFSGCTDLVVVCTVGSAAYEFANAQGFFTICE